MTANVTRRCGCRGEDGTKLGARCPKLTDPRHGAWSYVVNTTDHTGKRVKLRAGGFTSKREAERARDKASANVDHGNFREPSRQTFAEYLPGWLERHANTGRGLRGSTVSNYERYIRRDIAPSALGKLRLGDIRRHHIAAFIDSLIKAGRGHTTIHHIVAVVQSAFTDAVADSMIDTNPAHAVRLPKNAQKQKKGVKPWTPEQVGQFLDHAATHRLGILFEVAIDTFMRRGELLALRWDEDVDLEADRITVHRSRTMAGLAVVENEPKTASGHRPVDIAPSTTGALLAWQLRQGMERDTAAEAWRDSGYVFTMEDGRPLMPQYATRLFDQLLEEVNAKIAAENAEALERGEAERPLLPRITFHSLRHLGISLALMAGVPAAIVSKRAGHSSISITLDIYGHLLADAGRQAASAIAAAIPRAHQGHTSLV